MIKVRIEHNEVGENEDTEALRKLNHDILLSPQCREFLEYVCAELEPVTVREYHVTLTVHCEPGELK